MHFLLLSPTVLPSRTRTSVKAPAGGRACLPATRSALRAPVAVCASAAPSASVAARAGGAKALVAVAAAAAVLLEPMAANSAEYLPFSEPPITNESPKGAVKLAEKLSDSGAKMYGAFWCSHCFNQRKIFGAEAAQALPYVECYPDGVTPGEPMDKECLDAGIAGFPTWVVDGKKLPGEKTFKELSQILP